MSDKNYRLIDDNEVRITGFLADDAKAGTSEKGTKWAEFRLVHNRRYKQGDEWISRPVGVTVKAFNGTLQYVGDRLKKGTAVVVEGYLDEDKWEDKESHENRYRLYLNAQRIRIAELTPAQEPVTA